VFSCGTAALIAGRVALVVEHAEVHALTGERSAVGSRSVMHTVNAYCHALGIEVPSLDVAKRSPDANTYALLLAALLEQGEPMTLKQVARRFDEAGVAPFDRALASLKRCRPGRPPIYRDGDCYALDPHDYETDLWAFRLGLRPPKVARAPRPEPGPLPSLDEPLTVAYLDEAWRSGIPHDWSAQRIAVCVLDAHDAKMRPDEALAFVYARDERTQLSADSAKYWRRRSAIRAGDDGSWELDRTHDAVRSARKAIVARLTTDRRWAHVRPDPVVLEANRKRRGHQREAQAEVLAQLRRVLVHSFPKGKPEAIVLVDVGQRALTTLVGSELATASERLAGYDFIGAVDVRALLRSLHVEPGERRLAELGPPQKTMQRMGSPTLRLTTKLLVQGSCGISRPFGDPTIMRGYLHDAKLAKLRHRLEADAKSLFALYQYGRLHGAVRLRWGFDEEMIPVPWVHREEPTLFDLMNRAHERDVPLEVVHGAAPSFDDPWSRVQPASVVKDALTFDSWLVDVRGVGIDEDDVQLAR